jgi:hypothetical protein
MEFPRIYGMMRSFWGVWLEAKYVEHSDVLAQRPQVLLMV